MPILDEIEQWFAQRPRWQQQGYAELRAGRNVDSALTEEIASKCVQQAGQSVKTEEAVKTSATPSAQDDSTGIVRLLRIENAQNINRLAAGQTFVLAAEALTSVYGDNGAGKTGYGRILRQVCQARGPASTLRGNVFSDVHAAPSAEVVYSVDGGEEQRTSIHGGAIAPSPLHRFSIFDSSAAAALVEQETDTAFRPFGLDLLDRFTALCDAVRGKLDKEIQGLAMPSIRVEDYPETTGAGRFVRELGTVTGRKKLDAVLQPLSEAESEQLKQLGEIVAQTKANDPKKLAQNTNAKASRIQALGERIQSISGNLTPEMLAKFAVLRSDGKKADDAAEIARTKAFANEPLQNVGGAIWQRLWKAARDYAPIAQPGIPFPTTSSQGRCVLCAQPLNEVAVKRMATLEEFVKGSLEADAAAARKKIEDALRGLDDLQLQQTGDESLFLELQSEDDEASPRCVEFLKYASATVADIRGHLASGEPAIKGFTAISPLERITKVVTALRQKALQFQEAATVSTLAAQQATLAGLEAKSRLVSQAKQVREEAVRHARIAILESAKKSTATRAISELSGKLTEKYVSEALCGRFRAEIKRLGLNHLEVELTPVGVKKGTLYHQIRLKAKKPAPMREIVSEGEFRCLALAAFLAEVGDSSSGILFDDPVSSLDHSWRERIAQRLGHEARSRQVIVFTHDIVFHNLLRDACATPEINVSFTERSVERRGGAGAGFCVDAPPWSAMTTKKRIGVLNAGLQALKKQDREGAPEYEGSVRDWYGRLREAWERSIEECLLNEAVVRYRRSISTKLLKKALESIQPNDYTAIDKGMTRTSAVLRGHDDPSALNQPVPTVGEAEQDLQEFTQWVATKR